MITLREYQRRALDELYEWIGSNDGNPCLVLPTGAGKSVVIAALVREVISTHGDTRFLMLTHSKELIAQNAERLRMLWPEAPLGVYSAGLGSREISQITFAGIQSVYSRASELGEVQAIIVDECHLISPDEGTMYQRLFAELKAINPDLRIIGLTATPWRLGLGRIDDGVLFDAILEPVLIEELVRLGHLAPLRSKLTQEELDVSCVGVRGGEFIDSELQDAIDRDDTTERVCAEIIARGQDRKHWLIFCCGVAHAVHVYSELRHLGISCAVVQGDMDQPTRDRVLAEFKIGQIQAVCNVNVLSTGFDFPAIDLIAFLRPTMSPVLYMQQAGRGMRTAPGKTDCLVLDFAGNVQRHGPVVAVQAPTKTRKTKGDGEPLTRLCDRCSEICLASARECSACGFVFEREKPEEKLVRHDDDVMGLEEHECLAGNWTWTKHTKKETGEEMLRCDIYPGDLAVRCLSIWLGIKRDGAWGTRCRRDVLRYAKSAGVEITLTDPVQEIADRLNYGDPPSHARYKMNGKFPDVRGIEWRAGFETKPIARVTDDLDVWDGDDVPF